MERALVSESAVSDTESSSCFSGIRQEFCFQHHLFCCFFLLRVAIYMTSFVKKQKSLKKLLQKAQTDKAIMLVHKYSIKRTFRRKLFFSQAWDLGIWFNKLWFQQQWHGTFIYIFICITATALECFPLST